MEFLNEISGNLFTVSKALGLTLIFFFVFTFSVGSIFMSTIHTSPGYVQGYYALFLLFGMIMMKVCYYLDFFDAVMKSCVLGVFNYFFYTNACYILTGQQMIYNSYAYNMHFFNPIISPFFLLISTLFMSLQVSVSRDISAPPRIKRICKSFGRLIEKKNAAA